MHTDERTCVRKGRANGLIDGVPCTRARAEAIWWSECLWGFSFGYDMFEVVGRVWGCWKLIFFRNIDCSIWTLFLSGLWKFDFQVYLFEVGLWNSNFFLFVLRWENSWNYWWLVRYYTNIVYASKINFEFIENVITVVFSLYKIYIKHIWIWLNFKNINNSIS